MSFWIVFDVFGDEANPLYCVKAPTREAAAAEAIRRSRPGDVPPGAWLVVDEQPTLFTFGLECRW